MKHIGYALLDHLADFLLPLSATGKAADMLMENPATEVEKPSELLMATFACNEALMVENNYTFWKQIFNHNVGGNKLDRRGSDCGVVHYRSTKEL